MEIGELHILNYLEGDMSAEERAAFEEKVKESPSLQKEVDDLRFLLNAVDNIKELHQVNTVSRWEKMSRKVFYLNLKHKIGTTFNYLSVFAFIPFLLLTAYLGLRLSQADQAGSELIEVQSAYGLVTKIVLPDSSVVFLNSGSKLSYPGNFTEKIRTVSLKGEAYFVVKANSEKRFEVKTADNFTISAYGTEFNVNAYEEQGWVGAALVSGNVAVSQNERANRIIQPGQSAVYNKNTKDVHVTEANLYVTTAWKDGKIIFRRAKMPEIIYRLSKHFNVDIELRDKDLEQYEFSATFTTETLTEILNLMKKASQIKWDYVEPVQLSDESYTKRKVILSLM